MKQSTVIKALHSNTTRTFLNHFVYLKKNSLWSCDLNNNETNTGKAHLFLLPDKDKE